MWIGPSTDQVLSVLISFEPCVRQLPNFQKVDDLYQFSGHMVKGQGHGHTANYDIEKHKFIIYHTFYVKVI